jgi:hypothetical protein
MALKRRAAGAVTISGALLIIGGLGWLFGPWALVAAGVVLVVVGLFGLDVGT